MKKHFISGLILALLLSTFSCKEKIEDKVLTKEIQFTKEGELKIIKATNDSIVAQLDIEIAESDYETQTGLMYRKGMEKNQGMLFLFEKENPISFYMKNTEFPLDIIYINGQMKIVNVHRDAQPFDKSSLPSKAPAKYVLEVNAGMVKQWRLLPGDIISFQRTN